MYDRARLIELVERAMDDHPYCPACDSPTEIADEDRGLVLRCTAAASATSLLGRIGAAVLPHIHTLLVEREELLAA